MPQLPQGVAYQNPPPPPPPPPMAPHVQLQTAPLGPPPPPSNSRNRGLPPPSPTQTMLYHYSSSSSLSLSSSPKTRRKKRKDGRSSSTVEGDVGNTAHKSSKKHRSKRHTTSRHNKETATRHRSSRQEGRDAHPQSPIPETSRRSMFPQSPPLSPPHRVNMTSAPFSSSNPPPPPPASAPHFSQVPPVPSSYSFHQPQPTRQIPQVPTVPHYSVPSEPDPRTDDLTKYTTFEISPDFQGSSLVKPLEVSLENIYFGVPHQWIVIKRTQYNNNTGTPFIQNSFGYICIKKGQRSDSKVLVQHRQVMGRQALHNTRWNGSPRLEFVVKEIPHPILRRVGHNLHHEMEIELQQAICGFTRELRVFDTQYKLSAKGSVGPRHSYQGGGISKPVAHQQGVGQQAITTPAGDLIIDIVVKYPPVLLLNEDQLHAITSIFRQCTGTLEATRTHIQRRVQAQNHQLS
ncbi:hypothetical protein BDV95DRAFT_575636 [Massariosphaeria phaeospora]|uniref:Chaperone DnaJ C-terminal domain-containing protein n=1 Tax=Massariosphaeria phaeospora TaxID=100035 RepID=A0A7C8M853_9PLEO|nr:hypothetical protein BDV95DRAFT_575636 [Massariosphaeria phaeospora]